MSDVNAGHVIPPPPPCPNGFIYTVQPGDTMFSIAQRFGVSLQALINANPQVTDPNVIFPGQQLCVPTQFRPSRCRRLSLTSPFMQGDDVLAVQRALVARGFNPGPIDGIYGPRTEAAVRAFQQSAGLPATGVVDAATYRALGIICPPGN